MKKVGVVIVFVICLVFLYQAILLWQETEIWKFKNIQIKKQVRNLESELEEIRILPEAEIGFLQDYYRYLDEELRLFSQMYGLKMSLSIDGLKDSRSFLDAAYTSQWLGIKQLILRIHFYDLKEYEERIRILKYLKRLEESCPMMIFNILQSVNQLDIGIQLYGR